jgi:asparaginyl-tRNA synthetase
MRCAEDYVRFCCRWVLDHCGADMAFINKMYDQGAIARLEQVIWGGIWRA